VSARRWGTAAVVRAMTLAMATAMATPGCRGELRFDDHDPDAAADVDARPTVHGDDDEHPLDAAACGDAACARFSGATCATTACQLECHDFRRCSDSCGTSCSADCDDHSTCWLAAGTGANLRCHPDAQCTFAAGHGSTITCEPGSACDVRCYGACTVTCPMATTCTLDCGDDGVAHTVPGTGSCKLTPE